ncbi:hypothetical protein [Flavobacterium sp. HNIBRBA15423]|uniref:hypothetical protein n=1 Tax=Flavobacterium sp. HNIBRBA15423 TaxID=3458683 RepID=UPI0040448AF7
MKHLKTLLLFLLIFTSCTSKKTVTGLYGKCGKGYYACNQILLKSDNTFEYFVFMDVGGKNIIKGNWIQIAKDSIKLNTFNQPKTPQTTIKGSINPSRNNSIKIKLIDSALPIASAFIVVNDQLNGKATNIEGDVELEVKKLKTITYYYLGREETIMIDNPNYNEIEILIKDIDITGFPKYFTNQIILVQSQKLYLNDLLSLKKTRIQNKQW